MTTNGSAKIYQFPARGRFAANDHREDAKPVVGLAPSQAVKVVVSGGWYHDAAIQEAERTRKS
jgi:hypothetical protein